LPPTLPFQTPVKPVFPAFIKPSPTPAVGASLEEQLRAASASPSVTTQPLPVVEQPVKSESSQVTSRLSSPPPVDAPSQTFSPIGDEQAASGNAVATQRLPNAQSSKSPVLQELRQDEALPDGPSVNPKEAIPPLSEDIAVSQEILLPSKKLVKEPKTSQVVHLPPKDVQEARLQETEQKLEKAAERERKEDERLGLPVPNGTTDLASSPSSTVGPYSQATPRAPNHSPDTSPDTESFRDRLPPQDQTESDVNPPAQEVKDDHERALQEQMRQAREQARGDEESNATDDIERQLEDEQAIRLARDGKSRLNESKSASAAGIEALTDHAAEVVREIEVQDAPKSTQEPAADSLPTPTTIAPEPSTVEMEAVENAPVEPPQPTSLGAEHPTPPAEVDVEMDDAPLPVKDQLKIQPQPQPRPERMMTRVSSGAIRQKSVSEILGDNAERSALKSVLTPRSSDLSPSASPIRPIHEQKQKAVSIVVFAKPDVIRPTKTLQLYSEDYASLQGASQDSDRDYLQGLFQYQAHHPPRSVVLQDLVASARKTLSTAGTLAMVREQQDYKILKRVYQLQNANRWSLRQLQKSAEPERPITHQDHLLAEMKWMQTDFKEERKWKKGLAATFADWCAAWVNSSTEERSSLQVRARIPKLLPRISTTDEDMHDAPTPDLVHSGAHETESESFADDDELLSPVTANAPAGLFSLGFNDVVMKIDRTPASDAMFREIPLYEPMLEGASDVSPLSFVDPPILPVSKFVIGKLVSQVRGPPRKRSRYEYESEDEPSTPPSRSGTSAEHSMPSTPGRRLFHRNDLPPEIADVALFNPENRHIRDRLQASHQFRPPTEFPMPSVSFFENRNSSQWLWEEDQKLRALVKEYIFNWSLVAQQLALPSLFVSGSGRRTPWECFERWVQLEGLPSEMSKTQYFRTYQSRLEQAQRTVLAQHQAQQQLLQQQAQNGQSVSGQSRRRTSQPIRVERRRENRHLAIIDGMRKLARKRESLAHKQAESQKAAALRKAHEPTQPKTNNHTPQEVSRLKWEREEKLLKQKQLLMQQELHSRVGRSLAFVLAWLILGSNCKRSARCRQSSRVWLTLLTRSSGTERPGIMPTPLPRWQILLNKDTTLLRLMLPWLPEHRPSRRCKQISPTGT
jgi:chromatin modification-related protein VID21